MNIISVRVIFSCEILRLLWQISNQTLIMKEQNLIARTENSLAQWRDEERMALELIKTAGQLRFDKGVELVLFRYDIYDSRPSEVLNTLRFSLNYSDEVVDIEDALNISKAIEEMEELVPAKIDIGTLAMEWSNSSDSFSDITDFIHDKLRSFQCKRQ